MPEPLQLTLWHDHALPGQLPLFSRNAAIVRLSEMASGYCLRCEAVVVRHLPGDLCFHCENLTAEYMASRGAIYDSACPAAEPIREPRDWFGKRPPMEVSPAASAHL